MARDVSAWLNYAAAEQHDDGHPWQFLAAPPVREGAAIDAMNRIALTHPSRTVRQKAQSIHSEMFGRYVIIDGNSLGEPELDELLRWISDVEELVELIHDPK